MTTDITPEEVLDFWFDPEHRKYWFASTPELDQLLRNRFAATLEAAAAHQLDDWIDSPESALALVIVLDQFPLNMYRNDPKSFATEQQAVAVCRQALQRSYELLLDKERLAFLLMPLMHSESLDDQNDSVRLFEAAGLGDNLRFAQHHRALVQRFGRFPHRNAILGRKSSAAELEYLASDEAFSG